MLANRTTTSSQVKYKNDPAIMAWELANEPRPGPDGEDGEKNMDDFITWNHKTSAWIHSIDFATFHLWAKNWGWFDANRIDSTLPASISNARKYINHHIALARKPGKPITMEEF